jgi:SAM-dependent methyltransferase
MGRAAGVVYEYEAEAAAHSAAYLWPVLSGALDRFPLLERKAFEIGCGNGATAAMLTEYGFAVTGIDPSGSGIDIARRRPINAVFHRRSIEEDLAREFGRFPFVIGLEVVACVLWPAQFARRVFELLEPQGVAIVSAPFHGYAKNLALSLLDRWDRHLDPRGPLIRFFSRRSFTRLWAEAGFSEIQIMLAGRRSIFAKSMVAVLRKRSSSAPHRHGAN